MCRGEEELYEGADCNMQPIVAAGKETWNDGTVSREGKEKREWEEDKILGWEREWRRMNDDKRVKKGSKKNEKILAFEKFLSSVFPFFPLVTQSL
jgi:hypothetical protein